MVPHFSHFFVCFLLVIVLFEMLTKHSAKVLSSPKHKKAVMHLTEKIHVLVRQVSFWL